MISGVSALIWQTALMLLGAYFLGLFLGCWLRRRVSAPPTVAMESRAGAGVAARVAAPAGAALHDRFGRALDGGQNPAPISTGTPTAPPKVAETVAAGTTSIGETEGGNTSDVTLDDATSHASESNATETGVAPNAPQAPRVEFPPEESPIKPLMPAASPLAQIPPEEPPPASITTSAGSVDAFTPPMSAGAAAAAARAARLAISNRPAAKLAEQRAPEPDAPTVATSEKMELLDPPSTTDLPASAGSSGQATVVAQIDSSDAPIATDATDLTLIKGVTDADVAVLRAAGFTTFEAIATLSAADVARVSASLTDRRRISRENWIEQAQLLQNGGSTAHTRGVLANLVPRPSELTRDLTGVTVGDAPLSATPDVAEVSAMELPEPSAPADPAIGSVTQEGAPLSTSPVTSVETASPDVSVRAAFARERRGYADDLQQIDGINAEVEKLLNEQGVTRVAQIAGWTTLEQQRIDRLLGGMNRVRRENWVGQARRISGFSEVGAEGADDTATNPDSNFNTANDDEARSDHISSAGTASGEPLTELADRADKADTEAATPESNVLPLGLAPSSQRNNVSSLRSVRSEALVGSGATVPNAAEDDLKRIRGIGVLIEKRLRSMGYNSYEQIGSWTQTDVDRVNLKLDFRGRIERENWIEQARILAAGGQTEFSRRQERDED